MLDGLGGVVLRLAIVKKFSDICSGRGFRFEFLDLAIYFLTFPVIGCGPFRNGFLVKEGKHY